MKAVINLALNSNLKPTPEEVLRQYWGHDSFRAPQREIIDAILLGKDCLALLPTGGGKSVCFQVPAILLPGTCLVISPLIALMEDQIQQLSKKGISSVMIHSGMSFSQIDIALDNCVYGTVKLLYCSPERLKSEIFQNRIRKMKLSLIAVDEAHCISEWGYDFRPSYLEIGAIRELHPETSIIALTATATEKVCTDIQMRLKMNSPAVFKKSFLRENISFNVRRAENKEEKLLSVLKKINGCAVVYVRSRKSAESLSALIQENRITSVWYHAGLDQEERKKRQKQWTDGDAAVIVATNAFGMGIDKADVRLVVHTDLPETLESYYQEAGRAGRDGAKSFALLLFQNADLINLEKRIEQSYPAVNYLKQVYQALANFFQLAEGAGTGVSFPFDVVEFAARFNLKVSEVLPAIKRLEESGLILFEEKITRPSRILIRTDRSRLYDFQIAHEKFEVVLQPLLRMYGAALFEDWVIVSEGALAIAAGVTKTEIISLLKQLTDLRILTYYPSSDLPRLTYLTERYDSSKLPLDNQRLESRKKNAWEKMNAMRNYTGDQIKCRQAFILKYFNESPKNSCGQCDLCLANKSVDNHILKAEYRTQILSLTKTEPLTLNTLEENISPENPTLLVETIRELIEKGILFYDEEWRVNQRPYKQP